MKTILAFLSAVFGWVGFLIRSLFAALVNKSVVLYSRVVGYVDSQADAIRSVFAKKPCSATGGSA
jgi:hypothetical protein